jgi:hypothetical protein
VCIKKIIKGKVGEKIEKDGAPWIFAILPFIETI